MEIGVIYEAKLKPSMWMKFRLQTSRMEMMNWDKFDMDEIYQTHGFQLDCDEFEQTNAIKHEIQIIWMMVTFIHHVIIHEFNSI